MTMTMTNYEAEQHLKDLLAFGKRDIPVSTVTGFRILQNVHALDDALKPFRETSDKVIRKHAHGGDMISKEEQPDEFAACDKELGELYKIPIEVEIQTISSKELGDCQIPLNTLFSIDFMLKKE